MPSLRALGVRHQRALALVLLPMSDPELLLEMSDVARRLGMSYSGTYALVSRGDLTVYAKTPRGLRLFHPTQVEALAAQRERRKRESVTSVEPPTYREGR